MQTARSLFALPLVRLNRKRVCERDSKKRECPNGDSASVEIKTARVSKCCGLTMWERYFASIIANVITSSENDYVNPVLNLMKIEYALKQYSRSWQCKYENAWSLIKYWPNRKLRYQGILAFMMFRESVLLPFCANKQAMRLGRQF